MAHTPGPWKHDGEGIFILDKDNSPVAEVRGWGKLCYLGEDRAIEIQKANGELIAAAPDLLEALELALHVRGTSEDTPEVAEKMARAIARARGE